jgi:hypothetical protein
VHDQIQRCHHDRKDEEHGREKVGRDVQGPGYAPDAYAPPRAQGLADAGADTDSSMKISPK